MYNHNFMTFKLLVPVKFSTFASIEVALKGNPPDSNSKFTRSGTHFVRGLKKKLLRIFFYYRDNNKCLKLKIANLRRNLIYLK